MNGIGFFSFIGFAGLALNNLSAVECIESLKQLGTDLNFPVAISSLSGRSNNYNDLEMIMTPS